MRIKQRKYRAPEDDHLIQDFISRCFAATGHPYLSADPPNWARISAAARLGFQQRSIQLWEVDHNPQRTVVGLLLYQQKKHEFSYLVDPNYREIAAAMVDWVEEDHQATAADQKEQKMLSCTVCEKSEVQKTLLTQRGYVKGKRGTVFRNRLLDEGLLPPFLPQSFRFQEVSALSEKQFIERAAAETEPFGDEINAAFLRELNKSSLYRPQLDLVIITPDGTIAALATIWFDEGHQVGFFEPVATVAAHRRLGLGKALMIEGFRRLQNIGATTAFLGNDVDNNTANKLYESVGMPIFDQEDLWQKEVSIRGN